MPIRHPKRRLSGLYRVLPSTSFWFSSLHVAWFHAATPVAGSRTGRAYLDVEEVLDVEGDGGAVNGRVVVQAAVVGDVGPYGERHRLRLSRHGATSYREYDTERRHTVSMTSHRVS